MNILLTNAGRRTYFIDFLKEIKKKDNLSIHVSDSDFKSAALCNKEIKKIHITPKVLRNEKKYLQSIIKLVKRSKINLIIPLSDLDLEILSKNKLIFKKNKCEVAVSRFYVINNCYDKIKLSNFCIKNSINTPKIFKSKNLIKKFPIVIKERKGSGSKNIEIHKNKKFKLKNKNLIIQEFIRGTEYNIDIFNDKFGNFLSCCIKKKYLMRSGETDKCKIIKNKLLEKFSLMLSKTFRHIGNLDCDVILTNKKKPYLIDVNPRFGGGYPFTHVAGLNYLRDLIHNFKNKKISIRKNPRLIFGMKGIEIKSILKT